MAQNKHEEKIEQFFEGFCRQVIRHNATDYKRKFWSQEDREIPSSHFTNDYIIALCPERACPLEGIPFPMMNTLVFIENDALSTALGNLRDDKLQVLLLAFFGDLNNTQIGEVLQISPVTVAYRKRKGIEILRQFLEDDQIG